jgi:hypothetical protein
MRPALNPRPAVFPPRFTVEGDLLARPLPGHFNAGVSDGVFFILVRIVFLILRNQNVQSVDFMNINPLQSN